MKRKGVLVAACLMVCGLFLTQPAFAALYSGGWEPTGEYIITIEDGDSAFGFYDYNNETSYYSLANGLNTFHIVGDQVTVSTLTDSDSYTFALNEDGDAQLGFYMKEANGSTLTFFKEADVTRNSAQMYVLDFGGESTLELLGAYPTVDPLPTPVPTALLLLGSGLVGLVGFRRKTAQN